MDRKIENLDTVMIRFISSSLDFFIRAIRVIRGSLF